MIIQDQDNDVSMQDERTTLTPFKTVSFGQDEPTLPVINSEEDLIKMFQQLKIDTGMAEEEPTHVHIRSFKVDGDGDPVTVFDGMMPNPRYKTKESS
jgi:hypothetical protein